MADLISRQAVLKELPYAVWGKEWDEALAKAIIESVPTIDPFRLGINEKGEIYELPTIEAEPIRRGEWIEVQTGKWHGWKCSECGKIVRKKTKLKWCFNCGAQMERSDNGKQTTQ